MKILNSAYHDDFYNHDMKILAYGNQRKLKKQLKRMAGKARRKIARKIILLEADGLRELGSE